MGGMHMHEFPRHPGRPHHFVVLLVATPVVLAGITLIAVHFDANDPWFCIGILATSMGALGLNAALNLSRYRTLNDEFETGYRVGYRAGRRTCLSVARPETTKRVNTGPLPLRRRREDEEGNRTWPDSGDSPRGSTRRR